MHDLVDRIKSYVDKFEETDPLVKTIPSYIKEKTYQGYRT